MATVMIGVDPHRPPHTAVAINAAEELLGEMRVLRLGNLGERRPQDVLDPAVREPTIPAAGKRAR